MSEYKKEEYKECHGCFWKEPCKEVFERCPFIPEGHKYVGEKQEIESKDQGDTKC